MFGSLVISSSVERGGRRCFRIFMVLRWLDIDNSSFIAIKRMSVIRNAVGALIKRL